MNTCYMRIVSLYLAVIRHPVLFSNCQGRAGGDCSLMGNYKYLRTYAHT